MALVEIRNITKTYGKTEVLHGIDMEVGDGEFIVIVGPSGCGKSTLLRMVAGLEAITSGEISIDGRVVNKLEPKDRDIAMVFQNYALYPHMSVFGNMAYGLKLRGLPKEDIRRRVDEAATLLQLDGLLERRPRQLSGGQRQRVAMGRAIVREPSVFLFDEPLSNLDAKLRVQMRVEIRLLQRRLGVTSLYVTHDQVEAMTMADRLIVLRDGATEQIGTPMDIYNDPSSMFVAGFIGSPSMNFLPVEVDKDTVNLGTAGMLKMANKVAHSGQAVLGIRPEHFHEPSQNNSGLELDVVLVEPLGSDTLVHGRAKGVEEDIVVKYPGDPGISAGKSIQVAIDPERLYLFDPASEKRIG